jgi:hypothetical protein
VDSTVFDDAVATQDTVTQLVAAMRRVARVVAGAAEVIAAVCTLDYRNAGKPDIDWDDPAAKRALVSDLVNDALAVLEQLTGRQAPQRDQAAADALGLLALVAGQDVEPAEGSDGTDGRWVIARRVAPDRVVSTVDPQARHTRKSRSNRRDGYRGHLATEPDTGLITDCEMTMTTGEANTDAAVGVKMANRDRFHRADTDNAENAADTLVGAADITDADDAVDGDAVDGDAVVSTADTDGDGEDTGDTGDPGAVWRSTATRLTAPAKPATPTATPAMMLSSNRSRCPARCPAGSPSTTSPSTRTTAPSPARTATPGR